MYIKSLELKNYRNYENFFIEFSKNLNLIVGQNAQGKTNLIEAISLSSIGKSFRTSKDNELLKFGEETATIKVSAEKNIIDTKVEISINKQHKKSIKKDGNIVRKTSELIDNIIIVIFSPEDLKIVKDEPEKRRRFIDRELAQIKPAYYDCLSNYKKILAHRNAHLKEDFIDSSILEILDEQLISYGSKLMEMRNDFINKIDNFSGKIHKSITNCKEILKIKYDPNITFEDNIHIQKNIFRDIIKKSFEVDKKLRTTTKGPHKDDMLFFINGINVRNFGSQGQQRTCALSLKLAELDFIREEADEDGILLLDDVMSELDEERRDYLIKTLKNNQIFVTTTDFEESLIKNYKDVKIIEIENGKVI